MATLNPPNINLVHMSSAEVELESIQERYIQVLRSYLQSSSPQNPQARLSELLSHIPEVSSPLSLSLSATPAHPSRSLSLS